MAASGASWFNPAPMPNLAMNLADMQGTYASGWGGGFGGATAPGQMTMEGSNWGVPDLTLGWDMPNYNGAGNVATPDGQDTSLGE